MSSRLRRVMGAIGALVLAASLAACSGIPTSGSVHVSNASAAPSNPSIDFEPVGPAKDASPVEIVRGFLFAGNGPQNDFNTARKFLSTDFAPVWDPDASVLVYDGSVQSTQTSESVVTTTVNPVAAVDASGHFSQDTSNSSQQLTFELVQQDGQWRISKAADGIVLLQPIFEQVFGPHALYYLDQSRTYLVPDVRWFASGSAISTRIVSELLKPPSTWLSPAVVTAFPDGTKLAIDSVPVSNTTAFVELSEEVLTTSDAERGLMVAQLDASLSSVPSIGSVTILVDQQEVPFVRGATPTRAPTVDSRPLVMSDGVFGYSDGDTIAPIGLSPAIVALAPTAVTVTADKSTAAVLAAGGTSRVGRTSPVVVDARAGQVAPAIDVQGFIWTALRAPGGAIKVSGTRGTQDLAAPWIGDSTLVSIDISRDGTRALMLLQTGASTSLVVSAVQRDNGQPIALGPPFVLQSSQGQAIDATWVGESTVVSAIDGADGSARIVAQSVGGPSTALSSVPGVVSVAAGNLVDGIQVLTSGGLVLMPRGSLWQTAVSNVTLLGTQG